ncbi:MAG: hypothetical protein CDV28_10911 [Candidatus Electronema aureum]|uniref:Uncharacterized protein n=1 Tax=Candidatus Electronema aureum TaxID=2005002 RepID=A0A521G2G9_9BACT|nr:MAG: hypothetical protein CDV28_10911 [Candidatus Electronema aureum]
MGNNINIGNAKNSNVVGGNVHGNVSAGSNSSDDREKTSTANRPDVEAIERIASAPSSKTGLVLGIIFVLLLIVLFVVTR